MKAYLAALFLVLLSLSAAAHKDAPSTGLESGDISIKLEVRPQQVVVNQPVVFHLAVQKKGEPLSGAKVDFEVKKTATATSQEEVIGEFTAEEMEPGVYHGEYAFPEVHSYIVEGHVEDGVADAHIEKFIDAEQKGPSLVFWAYMAMAVLIALFIGYKGADIL